MAYTSVKINLKLQVGTAFLLSFDKLIIRDGVFVETN